jgi:hypothetical protein
MLHSQKDVERGGGNPPIDALSHKERAKRFELVISVLLGVVYRI